MRWSAWLLDLVSSIPRFIFGGKRELSAAMISDGMERLLADVERSIDKVDDPVEQLSRVLDVLLEYGGGALTSCDCSSARCLLRAENG